MESENKVRTMRCPWCGFVFRSSGIGAVYCGPHDNRWPAVRMVEVEKNNDALRAAVERHLDKGGDPSEKEN